MVIGIEGKPGVGKSSVAKMLVESLDNAIYIEESSVFMIMIKIFLRISDNKSKEEILKYLEKVDIRYDIIDKEVKFKINDNFNKSLNPLKLKMIMYKNLDYKEPVCKILYKFLNNVINKEKSKYNIVLSGRDLIDIYDKFDYHFTLIANDEVRLERQEKRDKMSNLIKEREELDKVVFKENDNTIIIDTTNISIDEVVSIIKGYL